MLLFVRKGCDFCRNLPKVKDLHILEVSQTAVGLKIMVEGALIPVPPEVQGLPALRIGHELILGKFFVSERLKKVAEEQGT